MRHLTAPVSALAAVLCLGSAAQADISLCNDFTTRIHVALAYQDQAKFNVAGWWNIDPSNCVAADFPFQGATLYYTANSDDYRNGGRTSRDHWGNKIQLFVSNRDFKFDDADQSRRGAKGEMFSQAELTPQQQAKPVAITLRFSSGSTAITIRIK